MNGSNGLYSTSLKINSNNTILLARQPKPETVLYSWLMKAADLKA